jgi:hypothetical protein
VRCGNRPQPQLHPRREELDISSDACNISSSLRGDVFAGDNTSSVLGIFTLIDEVVVVAAAEVNNAPDITLTLDDVVDDNDDDASIDGDITVSNCAAATAAASSVATVSAASVAIDDKLGELFLDKNGGDDGACDVVDGDNVDDALVVRDGTISGDDGV